MTQNQQQFIDFLKRKLTTATWERDNARDEVQALRTRLGIPTETRTRAGRNAALFKETQALLNPSTPSSILDSDEDMKKEE